MKNKFLFRSLYAGAMVLAIATAFTSCKKDNDIDENGSANVKVVNASPTSSAQGFYLADKTVVQGGLIFGNTSDYISVNSGNNLQLQFKNEGSDAAYATGGYDLGKGDYYTIFLAGDGTSARIKVFADDLSGPSSGKAKVRFAHLSDAAPANIDIRLSSGENLVAGLARDNASSYIEVDPGVLSLQVFETGQTTSIGNFDLTAFADGKIYTVYVAGSTADDISVHQVSHN